MFLRLGPGSVSCTTSPYHRVDGPHQAAQQETAPDDDIPHAARSDPHDQLTGTGDEPQATNQGSKPGAHLRLPPGRLRGHDGVSSSPPQARLFSNGPRVGEQNVQIRNGACPIRPTAAGRPDRRLRARALARLTRQRRHGDELIGLHECTRLCGTATPRSCRRVVVAVTP
jgi:hypothetical protein